MIQQFHFGLNGVKLFKTAIKSPKLFEKCLFHFDASLHILHVLIPLRHRLFAVVGDQVLILLPDDFIIFLLYLLCEFSSFHVIFRRNVVLILAELLPQCRLVSVKLLHHMFSFIFLVADDGTTDYNGFQLLLCAKNVMFLG